MQKTVFLIGIACIILAMSAGAASAATVGGDESWYVVHCNVDGAAVFFDGEEKGVIQGGELNVPVYTTGTPYQSYSVSKEGYTTFSEDLTHVPAKGETLDLYATLNPTGGSSGGLIGGDKGWYLVHCNVNGASVFFDGDLKGQITNGELSVEIYTTGTPYKQYTVDMAGYTPYTASITQYPAKGETVDLYATLQQAQPTAPAPSPLPVGVVLAGLIGAVSLLFFMRRE